MDAFRERVDGDKYGGKKEAYHKAYADHEYRLDKIHQVIGDLVRLTRVDTRKTGEHLFYLSRRLAHCHHLGDERREELRMLGDALREEGSLAHILGDVVHDIAIQAVADHVPD